MTRPLILRNSDIFLLWSGQVLSQAGTRMYQIALIWWVLAEGGGGGREAGVFMVMGALPALLFARRIGGTVDRTPAKSLLVGCDLASFVLTALVALAMKAGGLGLAGVYASSFLLAALQAMFDPTLNKFLAQVAEPKDLEEAVAFQTSTQALASFGGAVLGAVLIERVGILGVVVLNAASFLVSALANSALSRGRPAAAGGAPGVSPAEGSLSGWKLLRDMPRIKKILIGFGCANFFLTPILLILPLYVKQALRGGPSLLGALESAVWLGLVAGTFLAPRLRFTSNTPRLGAAALAISGVCLFIPGLVADRYLFGAMLFIAGTALGVNNVKFVALFQAEVAPQVKGRFFALMQALLSFTFPAAFFLFGVLADRVAVTRVCLLQGIGLIAVSAYFLELSREPETGVGPRAGAEPVPAG